MIYALILYGLLATALVWKLLKMAHITGNQLVDAVNRCDAHNLGTMITAKAFKRNIVCGLHSGFRWCDVVWFITGWNIIHMIDIFFTKNYKFMRLYHKWIDEKYEYIACPVCIVFKRSPREIKDCDCGTKPKKEVSSNENLKQA